MFTVILVFCIALCFAITDKMSDNQATISLVATILLIGSFIAFSLTAKLNCDQIGTVLQNNTRIKLYKDESNQYFYLRDSLLNPWKMNYRVYLDSEKVEQYLMLEEEIAQLDILNCPKIPNSTK